MKYSKKAPVKIVVLGAGGTGGYVIPHLYRLGYASEHPTRIIVCDGDVTEQKNLIRQNFVEQDIGRNKAQVLAERYAAAFGIECEYRPEFIETQEELYTLTEPDRVPYPMEPQRVILLGCVDNNKSRQLCHRVFQQKRDLIYIDAGNGEHTGQVVCGVRQSGRTLYKPICFTDSGRYSHSIPKAAAYLSASTCALFRPMSCSTKFCRMRFLFSTTSPSQTMIRVGCSEA